MEGCLGYRDRVEGLGVLTASDAQGRGFRVLGIGWRVVWGIGCRIQGRAQGSRQVMRRVEGTRCQGAEGRQLRLGFMV